MSVAATPDGLYCFGGGKSGKLYAWEVATGSLLKVRPPRKLLQFLVPKARVCGEEIWGNGV
jgi:hypothetical protein